ncbi:hypothetical protein DPMN_006785 [Dreissena polymorpha]|uniref:PNT domain-containing protein n=1 Tax=Dreissena polymorpha TaxID=45954 RepID=A0A9D4RXQ0_DREPO|nr:hypothetical protein DPMN_006785 [Dreissena polymorpha]
MCYQGHTIRAGWGETHPENWRPEHVRDWVTFVAEKYTFPVELQGRILDLVQGFTGAELLSLSLTDFRSRFGQVGEIVFTALQQILDISPEYEGRYTMFGKLNDKVIGNKNISTF